MTAAGLLHASRKLAVLKPLRVEVINLKPVLNWANVSSRT